MRQKLATMLHVGKFSSFEARITPRKVCLFKSGSCLWMDFFQIVDLTCLYVCIYIIKCIKGVLHPDTKISMFCLFSPSSRRKSILFMYGCDRCVWFKVKKHDIFFHGSTNLSCGTVQNIFFLFNLRNQFKINRINSCFYYNSWNHPFSVQKYIPMLKSSFTWLDLAIWSWPLFTIGDSNAPKITQNMYFLILANISWL